MSANESIKERDLPRLVPGPRAFVRVVQDGRSFNAELPEITSASAAMSAALDELVASAQADIDPVIAGLGYLPPVDYAADIEVDSSRVTVSHEGVVYAPQLDEVPFVTGAVFEPAKWRVVQGIVAGDLSADSGAGLVGYKARGLTGKLEEIRSILDFGGSDDGVFDNVAAVANAQADESWDGRLRFPRVTLGKYLFSGEALAGITVVADAGVEFIGAGLHGTTVHTNAAKVTYPSIKSTVVVPPDYASSMSEKGVFLDYSDADHTVYLPLNTAAELTHEMIMMLAADEFTAMPGGNVVADGDRVRWQTMIADGNLYCSTLVVTPGDELVAAFSPLGEYDRCAVVKCLGGYHVVYWSRFDVAHIASKVIGETALDSEFIPEGSQTHASYRGPNAMWSVRIYSRRRFSVLYNGVEVTGVLSTASDIVSAGFGARASSTVTTVDTRGWVLKRNSTPSGKRTASIVVSGDSLSAPLYASWPEIFRKYVDGTCGIRIASITNYAVSGEGSTQQKNRLITNGTGGASHVFICIGTNDIQGGALPADVAGNVGEMIDYVRSQFGSPIVWIPPLWYAKALTPGGDKGEDTSRYAEGAETRARIIRMCATKAAKCVDMTQVTGPMLAAYLATPSVDPFVRDNIHPTPFGSKVIAVALARAFLGEYLQEYTRETGFVGLPASGLRNAWTIGIQGADYTMSRDGRVSLYGYLAAGDTTSGTVAYVLPPHLRPRSTVRLLAASSLSTSVMVNITASGEVSFYHAAAATYVSLDGITYNK